MPQPHICPACGHPVTSDSVEGLCLRCLVRWSLVENLTGTSGEAQPGATSSALPPVPSGFSNYELLEEIARGGMGVVYRARQKSLNRIVAVKMVLFGRFADRRSLERFRAEAETAALLKHPNIVPIHEIGELDGQPWFAMDYIDGRNLAHEIQRGTFQTPPDSNRSRNGNVLTHNLICRLLGTVCDAVQHAHQHGVIHRDLKPANILLDARGEPHLTDFGLARRLDSALDLTLTGQAMGSPHYMPPEQASGDRSAATVAGDVYSLGAILYHMLVGRPPFDGTRVDEVIRAVLEHPPTPPRSLRVDVDPDLQTICLKCLEKEPARRYGSAQALADDLERFLRHEPIHARPVGLTERVWSWCRRKPALAALGMAVALLLFLVAAGSTLAAARLKREKAEVREQLWQSLVAQATARRLSDQPGRRFNSLDTIRRAAAMRPTRDLRNLAIATMSQFDVRFRWIGSHPEPPDSIRFDPRHLTYAQWSTQDAIHVRRVGDGSSVGSIPGDGLEFRWLHGFSHDGRYFAVHTTKAGNCVWDLQRQRMAVPGLPAETGLVFASDSNLLVTIQPDGCHLHDLDSGHTHSVGLSQSPGIHALALDPMGTRLAACDNERKTAGIVDLKTGRFHASIPLPAFCDHLAWSPDGRWLAGACADTQVYLWNSSTGERVRTMTGHGGEVRRVVFNHAGTVLASVGFDYTVRFWNPHTGAQLLAVTAGSMQLHFSPDDRTLAFVTGGDQFGILEIADGPEYRVLPPAAQVGQDLSLSVDPTGRLIAAGTPNGIQFWDAESGIPAGFASFPGIRTLRFDAQGGGLLVAGSQGLTRWPITVAAKRPGLLQIGPPATLLPGPLGNAAMAPNGILAVIRPAPDSGALVLDPTRPRDALALAPHSGAEFVSIGGDGQWVATSAWAGSHVRVSNARTGEAVQEIPAARAHIEFSPNGQWLATANSEYRLWLTQGWRPGPPLESSAIHNSTPVMRFTHDSRRLAVVNIDRLVRLIDCATGRIVAEFSPRDGAVMRDICFGPEEASLLGIDSAGQVHYWDLRAIRDRLADLKLDWESPPMAAAQGTPLAEPMTVELLGEPMPR